MYPSSYSVGKRKHSGVRGFPGAISLTDRWGGQRDGPLLLSSQPIPNSWPLGWVPHKLTANRSWVPAGSVSGGDSRKPLEDIGIETKKEGKPVRGSQWEGHPRGSCHSWLWDPFEQLHRWHLENKLSLCRQEDCLAEAERKPQAGGTHPGTLRRKVLYCPSLKTFCRCSAFVIKSWWFLRSQVWEGLKLPVHCPPPRSATCWAPNEDVKTQPFSPSPVGGRAQISDSQLYPHWLWLLLNSFPEGASTPSLIGASWALKLHRIPYILPPPIVMWLSELPSPSSPLLHPLLIRGFLIPGPVSGWRQVASVFLPSPGILSMSLRAQSLVPPLPPLLGELILPMATNMSLPHITSLSEGEC